MHWLDLVIIALLAVAGWVGMKLGAARMSGGLLAVPISLGLAFVSRGLCAPLAQSLFGGSVRTAHAIAFGVMLLLSLCWLRLVAQRYPSDASTPLNRWLGVALGVWGALVTCAIAVIFVSNYPNGRTLVNGELLWRLLNALQVV
ncbi:MAG: CvpA family protein [Chloroflexota bacterium]